MFGSGVFSFGLPSVLVLEQGENVCSSRSTDAEKTLTFNIITRFFLNSSYDEFRNADFHAPPGPRRRLTSHRSAGAHELLGSMGRSATDSDATENSPAPGLTRRKSVAVSRGAGARGHGCDRVRQRE